MFEINQDAVRTSVNVRRGPLQRIASYFREFKFGYRQNPTNVDRRFIRRFSRDESGQVLPFMALMFTAMLGVAGLSVDLGRVYYIYDELQSSTDAAAMAGAGALPGSTVAAVATTYSAVSGNKNANSNMAGVTMAAGYPKLECLNTLKGEGMACVAPANANAVQVKQQVTVPMYFMSVLGQRSMTITATSTAAMRGASFTPYNVAIIVDTTVSMSDRDSDSNCSNTRLYCALQGVQVLLSNLSPCGSSATTCGTVTSGNVASPVDKVSLYTFPGVTTSSVTNDYDCSGGVTTQAYTYPTLPNYQIVPLSSDYRSSDTSSSLATTSHLVSAADGKPGCSGMQNPGGYGTYYAGVIYAAQAMLVANAATGVQNVIIMLSDGDASASTSQMTSNNNNGTYPSVKQQCHQAVTAAAAAAAAGTHVYSVAYGAASSGCDTDTNPSITPCQTMQQIASAPQYFFSDYTASANNGQCISASQPTTNLNQIFTQIAGDFTVSRLIPNSTT
jgi:Flp pilus assembly protein TadG